MFSVPRMRSPDQITICSVLLCISLYVFTYLSYSKDFSEIKVFQNTGKLILLIIKTIFGGRFISTSWQREDIMTSLTGRQLVQSLQ